MQLHFAGALGRLRVTTVSLETMKIVNGLPKLNI